MPGIDATTCSVDANLEVPGERGPGDGAEADGARAGGEATGGEQRHLAVVVVRELQLALLDVDRVATTLVAVGDEHPFVVAPVVELDVDREVPERDQLLRAVALEGRRAREEAHLAVEGRVVGPPQQLEQAGAVVEGEDLVVACRRLPPVGELAHLVGAVAGEVDHLGRVGGDVVELPLAVVVRRAALVERDQLPPVAVEAAVPEALGVLLDVGARRGTAQDGGGEAGAVTVLAGGQPDEVEDRGVEVGHVLVLVAQAASVLGGMPEGHETTSGTRTPPACVVDLYSRKGVFEAIPQPRG